MIISEKQIIYLIDIAKEYVTYLVKDDEPDYANTINRFINGIKQQQSSELKEVN